MAEKDILWVGGCVIAAGDESTHLPVLLLMTSD